MPLSKAVTFSPCIALGYWCRHQLSDLYGFSSAQQSQQRYNAITKGTWAHLKGSNTQDRVPYTANGKSVLTSLPIKNVLKLGKRAAPKSPRCWDYSLYYFSSDLLSYRLYWWLHTFWNPACERIFIGLSGWVAAAGGFRCSNGTQIVVGSIIACPSLPSGHSNYSTSSLSDLAHIWKDRFTRSLHRRDRPVILRNIHEAARSESIAVACLVQTLPYGASEVFRVIGEAGELTMVAKSINSF